MRTEFFNLSQEEIDELDKARFDEDEEGTFVEILFVGLTPLA